MINKKDRLGILALFAFFSVVLIGMNYLSISMLDFNVGHEGISSIATNQEIAEMKSELERRELVQTWIWAIFFIFLLVFIYDYGVKDKKKSKS